MLNSAIGVKERKTRGWPGATRPDLTQTSIAFSLHRHYPAVNRFAPFHLLNTWSRLLYDRKPWLQSLLHENGCCSDYLLYYILHPCFQPISLPVPCLPPQDVTFDVPGLTSLLTKWKPVPEHCRNGIILGYRVKYRRLDGVAGERVENTTADILYAFLFDLDTFANYTIGIVAFTRKGEGNATFDLALPDNLGECLEKKE